MATDAFNSWRQMIRVYLMFGLSTGEIVAESRSSRLVRNRKMLSISLEQPPGGRLNSSRFWRTRPNWRGRLLRLPVLLMLSSSFTGNQAGTQIHSPDGDA